jgi:hypothetical protein
MVIYMKDRIEFMKNLKYLNGVKKLESKYIFIFLY